MKISIKLINRRMYRDSARTHTHTHTLPPLTAAVPSPPPVLNTFPVVVILTTNTTSLYEEEKLRELTLQQLFGWLVSEVMYLALLCATSAMSNQSIRSASWRWTGAAWTKARREVDVLILFFIIFYKHLGNFSALAVRLCNYIYISVHRFTRKLFRSAVLFSYRGSR